MTDTASTPAPKKKKKSFKHYMNRVLKRGLRPALNHTLVYFSKVGDPVVFDNALFPWTRSFEANFEAVRREALQLYALRDCLPTFQEVSPYQERISREAQWKTGWLHGFGHDSDVAQSLCPETTKLLAEVPQLQTAFFSMLSPGSHIAKHKGVYKGLVNFHLGLVVPKEADKCRIQVGDEFISWREGKTYVFDDTNPHEVWNDTGDDRIVLMLQFHRPFRAPGHQLSKFFLWVLQFTPYLRKPRQNVRDSEARLRKVAEEQGLLPAS